NWVKFWKVNDFIKGTLLETVVPTVPDRFGKKERVYVLKGIEGIFHMDKVKPDETTVTAGDIWRFQSKQAIDDQMTKIQIGQKIMFKLINLKPTTKGND